MNLKSTPDIILYINREFSSSNTYFRHIRLNIIISFKMIKLRGECIFLKKNKNNQPCS